MMTNMTDMNFVISKYNIEVLVLEKNGESYKGFTE